MIAWLKRIRPELARAQAREDRNLEILEKIFPPLPTRVGGGYQPITFDESPGVPPQGGTGTVRPSTFVESKGAPPPGGTGWENVDRVTRADGAAPLRRHIALSRDFDLDVHNMLWDADRRLLRGESIDLDHVASLIAEQVRKNLRFVYEPAAEGR